MRAHQPQQNAIPRLMTTSWDHASKSFIFTFSPLFVKKLEQYFKAPVGFVKIFLGHYRDWRFDPSRMNQNLGIRGCLVFLDQHEMGYRYAYEIVPLWVNAADGSEPVEDVDAHENFGCFCLTISLFSRLANLIAREQEGDYDELKYIHSRPDTDQVILFELGEEVGNQKAALSAWVHGDIRDLFFDIPDEEFQELSIAMQWVYAALMGKPIADQDLESLIWWEKEELRFWFKPPQSESAFGICFQDQELNPWKWGMLLSSDHVEHRFEQVVCIVALAVLQTLYDRQVHNELSLT